MSTTERAMLSIFEVPEMARRRGQRKGHLFERSGYWMLQYRVDSAEIDGAGKPKRARITVQVAPSSGPTGIGKRQAARVAWDEYLSRLDVMGTRPSSMRTLREFIEQRFEPDVMATLKPAGRVFYKAILWKHVLPAVGSTRLRDISVGQVQGLLNAKLKSGLSTQTVVHMRNCLSAVLRHAKAMQWYAGELPTAAVRLPEMRRKSRRAMAWTQVCDLAKALPEPCATLVIFLTLTGLRIGEAMGLRCCHLNLTAEPRIVDGQVIPPMGLVVRENYVLGRYQTLKTGTSYRTVPIPEWFAPRLASLATSPTASDAAVFSNLSCSGPIDQHNLAARMLKPVAKSLGMPWVSWHVFRHSNATLAEQGGFSVTERQRILGHAAEAMTMHYTQADLERLRGRLETMVDATKLVQ